MRIVIDLQAAQSPGSRIRGIGRYSLALAEAMARQAGDHEIWIALSHGVPDVIDGLRARFASLIPADRIVVWESIPNTPGFDPALIPRRRAAEFLRERFLERLAPDVIHTASLFEGWADDIVTSISDQSTGPLQAVTLYDLIPYVRRDTYLGDERVRTWYLEKIQHLARAKLLLAISEFTRSEAIACLGVEPERVVNISGACDPIFRQLNELERATLAPVTRARYGLSDSFVLYTGGFDVRKNIDGLIRAFALLDAAIRTGRQLVIVGHGPAAEVHRLRELAQEHGLRNSDIAFTDYVSDEDLRTLYNLCDLYVFPSFHEGFGLPALEAMACGAPVIGANATSLPEVIGLDEALFDPASPEAMARLMAECLGNAQRRQRLRDHAIRQVARFSWDESAKTAIAAMEKLHASRTVVTAASAVPVADSAINEDAARLSGLIRQDADYEQLRHPLARALALNDRHPQERRNLFLDVTMLAEADVGTGIQRVVRNVLRHLLATPPEGYAVRPVRFVKGSGYVHAREFAARFTNTEALGPDRPIDAYPGDVVLGLDLIAHLLPDEKTYFRWLRDRGVRLWFVVYDLLPVLRPEFFPAGGLGVFQRWYEAVGELAEGAVCISRSVADELGRWYDQIQPARVRPLQIGYFHLGADLQCDAAVAMPAPAPNPTRTQATFLMVGTIEPRKGHAQVLDAFERLWAQGINANLLIIGKPGWLVDGMVARLRNHPHVGSRLMWLERASDQQLLEAYASASALIMASEGEGFGLPLIEAAQHGLPMIVRDLPVFREVAGNGAHYFAGHDPDDLDNTILDWMELSRAGRAPTPANVRWIEWDESARQLISVVLGKAQDTWHPHRSYVITAAHPGIGSQNGRYTGGRMVPDGRAGYLLFGPYSRILAGRYQVVLTLACPDGARSNATFDVVAFATVETLFHANLADVPANASVELRFELHAQRDLEEFQVRLFVPAGDRTEFVSCTLERCTTPSPNPETTHCKDMESITK